MDNSTIGYSLWQHVNGWPDKPVAQIQINGLDKAGLSMALQQLAGTVIEKSYVDGSFRGTWPFAMLIRVPAESTASRLNAVQILHDFADWVSAAPLPEIGANRLATKIGMISLPTLSSRWEDGSEDYEAVFGLKYKETKGVLNNG